ncbi:MAG: YdaU family protein, partial [Rickettsiales bacterium]|nr:YdaU family protein [Rickettsiales bacterium]
MPAPPRYMRFYPAAYAKATIKMSMEEQGAYMRLLCLMWANGGSIENDDSYIAKALPINLNKWLKVKHKILPFLVEREPGYLTQDKLVEEYDYVSKKNSGNKLDES